MVALFDLCDCGTWISGLIKLICLEGMKISLYCEFIHGRFLVSIAGGLCLYPFTVVPRDHKYKYRISICCLNFTQLNLMDICLFSASSTM
ncbi:hypothetical protein FKM82_024735 [Ascaphus truei]